MKHIILIFLVTMIMGCGLANANQGYTDKQAIMAIIGEAENQGYDGMLAIACAIRNRGTLKGVYGLHALRVIGHKYSKGTYVGASTAWKDSFIKDITNGDTGWGSAHDLVIFKKQGWFKDCVITAKIGQHYFYRKA